MWGIPRPVIGAAIGAVIASILIWSIFYYHPFEKIPMEWKDTLSSVLTGTLSILGGMIEHWRVERKAKKLKEEASNGT